MADENFVEQKPQTNQVDSIATDAGIPAEPTNVPGPATEQNQKETQVNKDFNDKVRQKQSQMKRNAGKEPTFTEAQHLVLEEIKTDKEKQKTIEAEKLIKDGEIAAKEDARIQAALQKYKEGKEFAAENAIPFKIDEEFEAAIAQKEQEQDTAMQLAEEKQAQEIQKQEELEAYKQRQAVDQEKQLMKQQEALATAQDEQQKEKFQRMAERQKVLQDQIESEDMEMKAIDPNRFWNNKSTGQKIMANIGMILAGLGAGKSGNNLAYQSLQNAIDNDIKSQKLSNDQILAKKKQALAMVELNLKKMQANTQNKLTQAKISQMMDSMQQSQVKIQEQRLMAKKLASVDGLTREEVFALEEPMQKKMVMLSDGKFRPAVNAELAKKLNMETIPQAKDAIRGLGKLKEILNVPAAELNPILRAEAATIKQALKGSLRLELFGPGVMTDFESKMADKIIGDPSKILTFDVAERAKFDALLTKVKQGTIDKIRQAGVSIPKTKNEKILDQFMSKNKKIKRPEAINALIKLGYWDENADVGF